MLFANITTVLKQILIKMIFSIFKALLSPTVRGLQRNVCEPCFWALLWASHSAAKGRAAVTEPGGEAGLLHQHLQCLSHPWVPTAGGPHQHVAEIQGRFTQLHQNMLLNLKTRKLNYFQQNQNTAAVLTLDQLFFKLCGHMCCFLLV